MSHTTHEKPISDMLLKQIEKLCTLVKEIQGDTIDIVSQDKVSDASVQLQDVLNSTEDATSRILDAASSIQTLADSAIHTDGDKEKIRDYVMQIFEACTFQDITGQRIKKVLSGLGALQTSILKLAETAHSHTVNSGLKPSPKIHDSLMNGPELTHAAPSQQEIDNLFKSAEGGN